MVRIFFLVYKNFIIIRGGGTPKSLNLVGKREYKKAGKFENVLSEKREGAEGSSGYSRGMGCAGGCLRGNQARGQGSS